MSLNNVLNGVRTSRTSRTVCSASTKQSNQQSFQRSITILTPHLHLCHHTRHLYATQGLKKGKPLIIYYKTCATNDKYRFTGTFGSSFMLTTHPTSRWDLGLVFHQQGRCMCEESCQCTLEGVWGRHHHLCKWQVAYPSTPSSPWLQDDPHPRSGRSYLTRPD